MWQWCPYRNADTRTALKAGFPRDVAFNHGLQQGKILPSQPSKKEPYKLCIKRHLRTKKTDSIRRRVE